MSYTRKKSLFRRIVEVRSVKGCAFNFMMHNMAGQKLLLYNSKIPRVINISFNERTCMFKCRICPYSKNSVRDLYKEKSEMSFETLVNIVKSLPNDPYYSFDISSIGETLEYKPLSDSIAYMKKMKPLANTIISTNGVLLTEETSRRLIESGLNSMQISVFAGNDEDHQFITGSKTYRKVRENAIRFNEIKKELKARTPFTQAFMIETEETKGKSKEFVAEWSKYVDHAFVRPMYNLGEDIEGMTPTFQECDSTDRYPCVMPWYSTAIRSNGDVLACYAFHWNEEAKNSMVIGNINEEPLEKIWETAKHRKLRDSHLTGCLKDYPICQECNLWSAYTNIWSQKGDGSGCYCYGGISLKDYFTKLTGHRGG